MHLFMKSLCKISSSFRPTHRSTFPVARFKKIATVAATRVETMRDLLVNWNFFIETKVADLGLFVPIFWEQKSHFCLFVCCLFCILVQDVPAQDEAERLAETVRATFSLEKLPESFRLDETDFVHGLPKVSGSF